MKIINFGNVIRTENITNIYFEIEVDSIQKNIVRNIFKISNLYFYVFDEAVQIKNDLYKIKIYTINIDEYMHTNILSDLILNKECLIINEKINSFQDILFFREKLKKKKFRIKMINKLIS